MNRVPFKQRNSKINHDRDPLALSRLALLLFCGLVLASGFVYAATQHFAAVQYGYQTEGLRLERNRLLSEQQHLLLRIEQASAPSRLELQARELGLRPIAANQIETQNGGRQNSLPVSPALLNPSASFQR